MPGPPSARGFEASVVGMSETSSMFTFAYKLHVTYIQTA
jgi:hypothetical protein